MSAASYWGVLRCAWDSYSEFTRIGSYPTKKEAVAIARIKRAESVKQHGSWASSFYVMKMEEV